MHVKIPQDAAEPLLIKCMLHPPATGREIPVVGCGARLGGSVKTVWVFDSLVTLRRLNAWMAVEVGSCYLPVVTVGNARAANA